MYFVRKRVHKKISGIISVSISAGFVDVAVIQLCFWFGVLRYIELPGIYMDAVNPEYVAAYILNPKLANPLFLLPTISIPLLGNLYHGVQNLYISLPFFALLGLNVVALRLSQALFGAGILVLAYWLVRQITGVRLAALVAALGLATDIAFIASFRTQYHIILAGSFWLLLALYFWLLSCQRDASRSHVLVFSSGAAFGLAVYAYFVYLFFVPALMWMLRDGSPSSQRWRMLRIWCCGFVVGMLPYVLGYLSLILALGGPLSALEWIRQSILGLAPLSSKLGFWAGIENSWRNVHYAINDVGNELMIFGAAETPWWAEAKFILLLAGVLVVITVDRFSRSKSMNSVRRPLAGQSASNSSQFAWLPLSYLAFTFLLGNRLWVHHFSVLLPLFYILFFLAIALLLRARWLRVLPLVAVLWLAGNFHQQSGFFSRLEYSGGVGKMSDAINRMAEDARLAPNHVVYVFPEWGFFMPFALLTANQRPYEVGLSDAALQLHRQQGHEIRVAYWSREDDAKYQRLIEAQGLQVIEIKDCLQRDRQPAFRLLRAAARRQGL